MPEIEVLVAVSKEIIVEILPAHMVAVSKAGIEEVPPAHMVRVLRTRTICAGGNLSNLPFEIP